jgi:hypothetical protein
MQQKSNAWWTALRSSVVDWRYGLDILADDEQTLLEDPTIFDQNATDQLMPGSGYVQLDVTAAHTRSLQVSLRNTNNRYLPGPAGFPSGGAGSPIATGLVWYDVRYRPWISMRTGFDVAGNKIWDYTYLGIFVLTSPDTQIKANGSQIVLTLLDKSALLSAPYLVQSSSMPLYSSGGIDVGGYASGILFDDAMHDAATNAGVNADQQLFEPSTLTLPTDYAITEGMEWWTVLSDLASSMSHVIYFDAAGNLVRHSDPRLINAPSRYTYAPGPTSIISSIERKGNFSTTYNHVIVLGGSSTTPDYRGEAQVTDPSSPYHANQIGDRLVFVGKDGKLNDMTPDPNIGTQQQADDSAASYLAQFVGEQEAITIMGRNVPCFDAYDRFTVNVPLSGLNTDFLVQKCKWNLDNTGMQLDSVKWFTVGS